MNHWLESAEVLSRLAELAAGGRPAALATVVRIVGSSYRRPGAKLLVVPDGDGLGSVSGGCLEADVRETARQVLATGTPRLLHYDTAGEEEVFGLGLGCRGTIEIFVQPATSGALREVAEPWRVALAGDEPFAVATVIAGAGGVGRTLLVTREPGAAVAGGDEAADAKADITSIVEAAHERGAGADAAGETDLISILEAARECIASGRSACEEIAGRLVFVEVLQPPPNLVVCGAGDDALPLVERAADVGFRVTVADHREGLLRRSRFPRAAALLLARAEDAAVELPPPARSLAVVMTHAFRQDREWVRRLLADGVPYVGLLGSRDRGEKIRRAVGADADPRLYHPVGLDVGADGPRQVAISIVAELLAVVAGRVPRHLTQRAEAIHVG